MNDFTEDDAFEAAAIPLSQRAMARPAIVAKMDYLAGLNPAQRQGVETLDGPVLMLAGAGTGKTKALMTRIAHLVFQGRANPDQVLAVTFTNKAAKEMRARLEKDPFGIETPMRWMGTFHSVSAKLLRRHAELVGLQSSFTILDSDDQLRLLKQLVVASGIDEKRWPPRMLAGIIDGWKNKALTPDKVPVAESGAFDGKGIDLYAAYQRRLRDLNAVDFGDILLHMVTIFQKHPDVLQMYQNRFRYILVDEYQDTNVAQYLWLRLLAAGHKNICCVGDDDQSIYGWRGAEVGNILRFEADFPGAHVVRLEENYRSTPHILAAASGVIAANKGRLGKTLFTSVKEGEKVRLIGHWDGEEEARWIGEEIEAGQRGSRGMAPLGLDSMAILVRASHQMRAFEDRFLTIGLPYRVIGGPRFYERMEIRDAMAYFRLAVSPADDLAFERIVNTPKRGLGDKAVQTIQRTARPNGALENERMPLLEGARLVCQERLLGGKGLKELTELVAGLDRWKWLQGSIGNAEEINRLELEIADLNASKVLSSEEREDLQAELARLSSGEVVEDDKLELQKADLFKKIEQINAEVERLSSRIRLREIYLGVLTEGHVRLAEVILDESGYTGFWQNDKTPEAPGRLENLKELVKALENFENLQGFLEHVSLIMDNETEEQGEKVSIMTLHAAKGLEFPSVFLPGWEDGLFPSQRSMDESGLKGLEEERRLAYVGITRAEELCTISFAANRRVYGQWQSQMPSRFIDELPADHVEVLTPPGLYGGAYGAAGMAASASPAIMGAMGSDLHQKAHDADVYNSPGWRRLQTRSQQRGMSVPSEARHMTIDATAVSAFSVDDRVFHQKFGYGAVLGIEGDKLEIAFDKAGTKHVVARFIVSADAADDVPF
ncbi:MULTISPECIES: UvrD-helicase domain-containing protein [unclassified Yoonia]|uniref:UvrD-helicase domain-containing protein n=1 Tax=unclassified Yoonia TaxID=2629118 RepID=UPI002AFE2127|nr:MULTISPECIES: UvrD-helicase domain-containing protein [unclassified Yoonia]